MELLRAVDLDGASELEYPVSPGDIQDSTGCNEVGRWARVRVLMGSWYSRTLKKKRFND